ncbi:hypothetical protein BaRGS_00030795, partial [Batillaria attramentaria]
MLCAPIPPTHPSDLIRLLRKRKSWFIFGLLVGLTNTEDFTERDHGFLHAE